MRWLSAKVVRARKPGRTKVRAPDSRATSTVTSRVVGSPEGKMRRMRPDTVRPGKASRSTCTGSPSFSSTTSSSETPTRTTSVATSAMLKRRVWVPTASPASTRFSVTTPATGDTTRVKPIRVRIWSRVALAAAWAVRCCSYSGSVMIWRSRSCCARWRAASATWYEASAAASCAWSSRPSSLARVSPARTTLPSSTFTASTCPESWLFTATERRGSTTPDTVTDRAMEPTRTGTVRTADTRGWPLRVVPPPGPPAASPEAWVASLFEHPDKPTTTVVTRSPTPLHMAFIVQTPA